MRVSDERLERILQSICEFREPTGAMGAELARDLRDARAALAAKDAARREAEGREAAAVAVLRFLEWRGHNQVCPACRQSESRGHRIATPTRIGCPLAAALAEGDGAEKP
jgi:hypothetical protein